ncbi:MAG TPA: VCBS repeat-containing protein, partial [Polyangia bacterium]|nr:VCBS repeat-containing protein [Polyangia bacterium]
LPAAITSTGRANALALGDLNGDGKPDIAIAVDQVNQAPTPADVLLNNGDGSFRAAPGFAASRALGLGDLNGDGALDVVAATSGPGVGVFLNAGGGTFGSRVGVSTPAPTNNVVVADFNGDGRTDLATAGLVDAVSGTVSIVVNSPSGTFAAAGNYALGGGVYSMAVGDIDGDGDTDLIVAGARNNLNILVNRGNALFDATTVSISESPASAAFADLDGNGVPDLVLASGAHVGLLYNKGDRTFDGPFDYPIVDSSAIATGDLDGDGRVDLAVATLNFPFVFILRNDGDKAFAPPLQIETGVHAGGLALGDVNGDGKLDIVVAGIEGVGVLINDRH